MLGIILLAALAAAQCPGYTSYASERHPPFSSGIHNFPYQRPSEECRTYRVPLVESIIEEEIKQVIKDPDLLRLFENTWPNTLDTTVLWQGASESNEDEELSYIITGDINAMWLRDSANQLQSYKPILNDSDEIQRLYRGAINLQGRYIRQDPYCNAFQAPPESRDAIAKMGLAARFPLQARGEGDEVTPPYNPEEVWECKYELDSLAAFFQLSWDYYEETQDTGFFASFAWAETTAKIIDTVKGLMGGTYDADGSVIGSPYTWQRPSRRSTETVANNGQGDPVKGGIGLIRSFFRPSDDSTVHQYLIPANMMFSIMRGIDEGVASEMDKIAQGIVDGINEYAVIKHKDFGEVYAYEVDGFGSHALMDDANLPSLLSIPHLSFEPANSTIYQATRKFILGPSNPYYAYGPVLNATGGPHVGPGNAWPMGIITQILTSDDDEEILQGLKQLLGSTSGLGLIHETVNSHDAEKWTRPWFAWANGLFGQMILDLRARKPEVLGASFQG
jgi:meiotically up-regulated gene 157 (Mug157) protein